jgi:hypothetical protein
LARLDNRVIRNTTNLVAAMACLAVSLTRIVAVGENGRASRCRYRSAGWHGGRSWETGRVETRTIRSNASPHQQQSRLRGVAQKQISELLWLAEGDAVPAHDFVGHNAQALFRYSAEKRRRKEAILRSEHEFRRHGWQVVEWQMRAFEIAVVE